MVYAERAGKGLLAATTTSLLTAFAAAFIVLASKVSFLRKMLPSAGNGPSREVMETGCFTMTCYALSDETDGKEPIRIKSFIKVCYDLV